MSQLSDRQLRAIEALLMSASVEDAARRSGLSARTVHRYLSSAEFAEIFRERLRTRVEVASARLQTASIMARCLGGRSYRVLVFEIKVKASVLTI